MPAHQEIFFHVGLGKVASTYLQQQIFPQLNGVHYISTHKYKKSKQIISQHSEQKILVSREFDRQFEEEVRWFTKDFPEAKIIILLRRHDEWIASQYKRHVKNGFFGSFEEFLDLENDQGYWQQKDLLYRPKLELIKAYCQNPPLVLFYEDLKADRNQFVRQITNYMGIAPLENVSSRQVHKSFSEKQLLVLRTFCRKYIKVMPTNHRNKVKHWILYRPVWAFYHLILYAAKYFPDTWLPEESLISEEALQKVRKEFAEDWKEAKEFKQTSSK